MNEINLMNYKLIYEHLEQRYKNYSNNASNLGSSFSDEKFDEMDEARKQARHLYIRKMREILAAEQMAGKRDGTYTLDLDFEIDPETYLIT